MKVTNGNNVSVHYKGTLNDGSEFDNSHTRGQTLDFEVGTANLLSGFNDAVLGMTVGQTKTFTLSAAEAYGDYNPDAITVAPKSAFPPDFNFTVGAQVEGTAPTGQPFLAKIKSLEGEEVTLDVNHPLAGEDLNFEVELVEISDTETTDVEND
jgi:FKBP-type peptidyl-prolyl cis-trans isomerase 2